VLVNKDKFLFERRSIMPSIESFTYVIEPAGSHPMLNFGLIISSDSILETIGYYSEKSPLLILNLNFNASNPPAVLGVVQGANIIPQADARFHFVLSPAIISANSTIAFTTMTNIRINQERLDITITTPDGTNIPSTAKGQLTLQFRKRD
jgi:hypothetical protein